MMYRPSIEARLLGLPVPLPARQSEAPQRPKRNADLRLEVTEYAVRRFRGDRLVGCAVLNGWGRWHIPLPPRDGEAQWTTVATRAEAIAALGGGR